MGTLSDKNWWFIACSGVSLSLGSKTNIFFIKSIA